MKTQEEEISAETQKNSGLQDPATTQRFKAATSPAVVSDPPRPARPSAHPAPPPFPGLSGSPDPDPRGKAQTALWAVLTPSVLPFL